MSNDRERTDIDRRTALKAVGGTVGGLAGLAGTASATGDKRELRYHFFGCSQVCVNRRKVTAVVWTGKTFRYACITQSSDRNEPPVRDWKNVYCYEVKDNEAIVGLCYKGDFIPNPNRCAQNYPMPKKCKNACD